MYKSFWGEELSKFSPLKKNEPLCKKTNSWCPILRCVLPIIPCQSWVSWPRPRQRHMPALTQIYPKRWTDYFPFALPQHPNSLSLPAVRRWVSRERAEPSLPFPAHPAGTKLPLRAHLVDTGQHRAPTAINGSSVKFGIP